MAKIAIRHDGIYSVRDIFGKPLEYKVKRGSHVLFLDKEGVKRLGFVSRINVVLETLDIMDDVVYPHAPAPMDEPTESIPWNAVIEAGGGFYRPRRTVWILNRKSLREVWVIDESGSDVGFVVTKAGMRLYVEKCDGRWIVR